MIPTPAGAYDISIGDMPAEGWFCMIAVSIVLGTILSAVYVIVNDRRNTL